jgi:hypothetical protein
MLSIWLLLVVAVVVALVRVAVVQAVIVLRLLVNLRVVGHLLRLVLL